MRLGGPVFETTDPENWIKALKQAGYSAAYTPVDETADEGTVQAYLRAAKAANVVIAEVGAWSNPLSPDAETRRKAIQKCQTKLALAERIGARCCVNITGSRGAQWDGPDPLNLTAETFEMIVDVTREIIDAVKPTRTYYTLETMPWAYPDSARSYAQLLEAIDRPRLAVHLDPVNLICSPQRYYDSGALIRECFARLGRHIKSCHGKDITLSGKLTVHLDEIRPGLGGLDYATYLTELTKLAADTPLMLEHMKREDYAPAAEYVRSVADRVGVKFVE